MLSQALLRLASGIGIICVEMKVLFVCSGNHGKISPIVKSQGDSLDVSNVKVDYFLIKGKGLRGYLRQVKPLRRYIKEKGFDVIHAHYSLSAFTASIAAAKPLVVSLMGSDVKANRLYKLFIRIIARFYGWKEIIVKSRDMYDDLGIRRAKIVPNGVNMDLFTPLDQEKCRQSLGWNTDKIHVLFPANPARQEKDYALAEASIALLGLDVDMHVFNQVEHQITPLWYNAADVVLLTSKWEGSPNVIKEAMACDRPIVSVDVGDVRERIECVEGCFVAQTRTPDELANLLRKALAFKGKTGGRSRILSEGLDNKTVAKKLMEIYRRIA